jgi:membrane-bound lytic murein transglycosylase D
MFSHYRDYKIQPVRPKAFFSEIDTVHVNYSLHLDKLSEILGVDPQLMRYINPRYTSGYVPANTRKMYIHLPVEAAARYVALEDHVYGLLRPIVGEIKEQIAEAAVEKTRDEYVVKKGDGLGRIAARHGCSVNDLKQWNHLRSEHLRIGQRLMVYKEMAQPTVNEIPELKADDDGVFNLYVIQNGDTLWDIARRNGLTPEQLKNFNEGIDARNLKPGDKIVVGNRG